MDKRKDKQARGNPRIAKLGRATRFRPGQSGNPGGRPSRTPYTDAHREVAELQVNDLRILPTESVAIAIAKSVAKQALKGSITAAAEAANRAEGTPRKCPETELSREILMRFVTEKPGRRSAEQTKDLLSPSQTVSEPE